LPPSLILLPILFIIIAVLSLSTLMVVLGWIRLAGFKKMAKLAATARTSTLYQHIGAFHL